MSVVRSMSGRIAKVRNGNRGSVLAVHRGLTATRRDAAVHEAGIGQEPPVTEFPTNGGSADLAYIPEG